jgi:hypothetical protein
MYPNISRDVAFPIVLVIGKEIAQPFQHVPWKQESKSLSEVLTMPTSANESQFQETSTSSQRPF